MARAIDHDIGSGAATVATKTVTGGLFGLALPTLTGALIVGGLAAGLGLFGALAAGAAVSTTIGVMGIAGMAGGLFGGAAGAAVTAFPPVALVLGAGGSLLGAVKGGKQWTDEKHAYDVKKLRADQAHGQKHAMILNQGRMEGYKLGWTEREMKFANDMAQMQAMQEQFLAAQGQSMGQGAQAVAIANCNTPGKADAITAERAAAVAAAAAGTQAQVAAPGGR